MTETVSNLFLQEDCWKHSSVVLAPMPSWFPVNRSLPSLLYLRLLSRRLGEGAEVIAAGGNNYTALQNSIEKHQPDVLVVEAQPGYAHLSSKFADRLRFLSRSCRLVMTGACLKSLDASFLKKYDADEIIAENPWRALFGRDDDEATGHLRPSLSEIAAQPLWEKRRTAVGVGCPASCRLCPRWRDELQLVGLRDIEDVYDEIEEKIRCFGVRDVEVTGTAWAGNPEWGRLFLSTRIRKGLDIRLHLTATIDQLVRPIIELLVPSGCVSLNIRANAEHPEVSKKIRSVLKTVADRVKVRVFLYASSSVDKPENLADIISSIDGSLRVGSTEVLLQESWAVPSCYELGNFPLKGKIAFHKT